MKKILFLVALLTSFAVLATSPVYANHNRLNSEGLTDEQIAEINLQATRQRDQNKKAGVAEQVVEVVKQNSTSEQVSAWVKVGSDIGKGLAGAAKELGIAVNEFAQTPVGRLTIWLIIWKMMGVMIVHIVAGGFLFCMLTLLVFVTYRKYAKDPNLTVRDKDGALITYFFVQAAVTVLSIGVAFTGQW